MVKSLLGYNVDGELFRSRRALIYRAHKPATQERVLLKVLRQSPPSPEQIGWFRRESAVTEKMSDIPGVIKTFGCGADGDQWVMALEDIGGAAMTEIVRDGPMKLEEALFVGHLVAEALQAVHERHYVHKDVNPNNIVYNRGTGQVRLIDFGLATPLSTESPGFGAANELAGTLAYFAPEQTGRMNRSLDHRADLYALGATLYHLLTGRPPFVRNDELDLIHAHIAVLPQPVTDFNTNVPPMVATIVHKLLAKNAEDRYQTADGVHADLLRCYTKLRETGEIEEFAPDAHNINAQFVLPQKLYGRAAETSQLLHAFTRASAGNIEFVLVTGYSGVGKTAVVQELYRPLTQRHGYWIAGKFDQYQRNVPYSSVVRAFRGAIQQVLSETDQRVERWRSQLFAAVGPQLQLLVALMPELGRVVGELPDLPALPPAEAQLRFEHAFALFVGVFADAEHPLTVFLDDLQWADPGSLTLIEGLLLRSDVRHLLLVGAYRDNEVDDGHPLRLLIGKLERAGRKPDTLTIKPLEQPHVVEMVADTLQAPVEEVRRLAARVFQKTHGNPFFAREFLKSLHAEKLLRIEQRRWVWDIEAIDSRDVTDNVVDFMTAKLKTLPPETQILLQIAGTLGTEFSLADLSIVAEAAQFDVWCDLWPAISGGLVVALDETWKLLGIEMPADTPLDVQVRCRFVHDRVQQAAYQLVEVAQRPALHWRIGRRLLVGAKDRTAAVPFSTVGHLNAGTVLATAAEQIELARLNLDAAQRAKASAAFATAKDYARTGLLLAGEATEQHDLRMALLTVGVETGYQTGDFAAMEAWFAQGKQEATDPLELAWMQEITTEALNARGRPLDALTHCMDYLDVLGVVVPRAPTFDDVVAEMTAAAQERAAFTLDQLAERPDMTDARIAVAAALICKVYSSAYVASPLLFAVITLRQFRLVMQHGNCAVSALAYAVYGLVLAALAGDVKTAYHFGKLSQRMLNRPDIHRYHAQALHLFSCHTRMWSEPLSACADGERRAYQVGLETGEMEFGSYGGHVASKYALFHGQELTGLRQEIEQYTTGLRRYRNALALTSHLPWHQTVLNLTTPHETPWKLVGPICDSAAELPGWQAANNRMAVSNALLAELQLAYLFGQTDLAVALAAQGATFLDAVLSQYNQPQHAFFAALARLRLLLTAGDGIDDQARAALATSIQEDLDKLRGWAAVGPVNFAHRVALVHAEQLNLAGEIGPARDLYEQAIDLAETNLFHSDAALAHELAGRFFVARGRKVSARFHIREACNGWQRWGAVNKVTQLETEFPDFIHLAAVGSTHTSSSRSTEGPLRSGALDFAAVVRASQAISSEVVLPSLLAKLVVTLMESAGAARALLLLDHDGELRIEAQAHSAPEGVVVRAQQIALDSKDTQLPMSVVHYVVRTGEAVVLDDALTATMTGSDPYAQMARLRSVLCQPVFGQGRFRGVIYLENSLSPSVFTPDRTELVGLLAGQIAVSIDNARLYETLELRVAQRTSQLEARNSFIRKVFGRYVSDDVVDTVLQSQDALALGGERRVVTIMFTDIRGFTAMCEVLRPELVVQMLNTYIRVMTGVIQHYNGTIDNIIGDGMVVLFGAPIWRNDDPERAVACAVAMQGAMTEVNAVNAENGLPALALGIGIHTGEVIVGNIGSEQRAKYSVIGRNVNIASRVESMTSSGQVFVTAATHDVISVPLRIDGHHRFMLKGLSEEVAVYQVGAVGGPFDVSVAAPSYELLPHEPPLLASVQFLTGKSISAGKTPARVLASGLGVLEVAMEPLPTAGTALQIVIDDGEGRGQVLQGKVAEVRDGSVLIPHTTSGVLRPRSLSSGAF